MRTRHNEFLECKVISKSKLNLTIPTAFTYFKYVHNSISTKIDNE